MRIAVFSDIHGNSFALKAVLDDIATNGHFDALVAAGDISLGGSDPVGCVDLLREVGAIAVYGNTDRYLTEPDNPPPDELHLKKWDHLRAQVDWALHRLGDERVSWLCMLPFSLRFSPPPDFNDDLLIFHGNPQNVIDFIFPPPEQQPAYFDKVLQPDEDNDLAKLMQGVTAKICAFGHMHITSTRKWREYTLVNVAPCSMPALDKDPRARYTIFDWKNDCWQINRKYVEYDYRQEVAALQASGIPFVEDFIQTFP